MKLLTLLVLSLSSLAASSNCFTVEQCKIDIKAKLYYIRRSAEFAIDKNATAMKGANTVLRDYQDKFRKLNFKHFKACMNHSTLRRVFTNSCNELKEEILTSTGRMLIMARNEVIIPPSFNFSRDGIDELENVNKILIGIRNKFPVALPFVQEGQRIINALYKTSAYKI